MSSRLIVMNYAMDDNNPIFSHQAQAVQALSPYFHEVTVITGSVGIHSVPSNVKVISTHWVAGKKLVSVIKFLVVASRHIFRKDVVIFSHMTEVQSALISPFTKVLRIPHWLWYAHKSKSKYLNWCAVALNGIITSTPGSCPISGNKVLPIGQGVNPADFMPSIDRPVFKTLNLIHVGRFDPSKNIPEIIQVCKKFDAAGTKLTFTQVGSPSTSDYRKIAERIIAENCNLPWLEFHPSVPRKDLSVMLSASFAMIHAYRGSLDKTLVEATMQEVPVITVNQEYLDIFGSWSKHRNPSLDSELEAVTRASSESLKKELSRRRTIALKSHSLNQWADSVAKILIHSKKTS